MPLQYSRSRSLRVGLRSLAPQRALPARAPSSGQAREANELELGGLLDRHVGRVGALEDLVHVHGAAPVQIRLERTVLYEAPATTISLGGLQTDQLKLRCLINWQFARLRTLEDTGNVARAARR
jgi:hypothetical protein